jgi:hypothetical protein
MVGVLEAVEALVRNANQLVGLLAILRESGDAVIHADADLQLQRVQHFGKNRFNAAAEGQGLLGVGLRQDQSEFISTNAKSGV